MRSNQDELDEAVVELLKGRSYLIEAGTPEALEMLEAIEKFLGQIGYDEKSR